MLAYACQLGQKALKVGNYIIYFPVYLDTIYTLSLFLIPMQCSVFTSQKHPKHHFERHKVINFTMDCQWAQHSFCNLHPQPGGDSQSHLWTSGCLTGCSEAAWVGESLVGHWWLVRLKKKTRIKINVQVSQVLQMSCALLGALARDFLSHKILTMIEISSL